MIESKKINVNIYLDLIEEKLDLFLSNNLGAEIYISGENLDEFLITRVEEIGEKLSSHDLFVTVHGPYADLNPGFSDSLLRETVVRRLSHAIDFASSLKAVSIVIHSGVIPQLSARKFEKWFNNSLKSWEKILAYAVKKNVIIAVENIFDDSPGVLRRILDYFSSPYLSHCFDIGHHNLFVKDVSVEEWIDIFQDKLLEVHIHDNHGKKDEHLPLGEGEIDWQAFFKKIDSLSKKPILTLENHSQQDIEKSILFLKDKI